MAVQYTGQCCTLDCVVGLRTFVPRHYPFVSGEWEFCVAKFPLLIQAVHALFKAKSASPPGEYCTFCGLTSSGCVHLFWSTTVFFLFSYSGILLMKFHTQPPLSAATCLCWWEVYFPFLTLFVCPSRSNNISLEISPLSSDCYCNGTQQQLLNKSSRDVTLWDSAAGDAQPNPSAVHCGLPRKKGLAWYGKLCGCAMRWTCTNKPSFLSSLAWASHWWFGSEVTHEA